MGDINGVNKKATIFMIQYGENMLHDEKWGAVWKLDQ
jgi:hypothetical protein